MTANAVLFIKFLTNKNVLGEFTNEFKRTRNISLIEFLDNQNPLSYISGAFFWNEEWKFWSTLSNDWYDFYQKHVNDVLLSLSPNIKML